MKIFEFLIGEDDDTGVKTISLVDAPAMQSDFIAFDKQERKPKYISLEKEGKEYKGVVAGLSMIPDKLIYRIDPDTQEEYYGYFTQDTIEKIRNKYHKELMTSNVNLDHDENAYINAYLIESYILSTEARVEEVKAQGISEAAIGSWYTQFKIEDEEVFQKVLDGEFNGFSIEAYLNREITNFNETLKNNFKLKEKKMKKNLIERFKDFLVTLEAEESVSISLEDALVPEQGFTLSWGEVGAEVTKTYTNDAGEEVTEPVGQGEFTVEDGRVIVVDEGSMLIEVREAEAPAEDPAPEEVVEEEVVAEEEVVTEEVPAEDVPAEKSDLDKSLNELLDLTKNGEYSVMVSVQDGKISYGAISSWQEIRMASEVNTEVEALNAKIAELEQKLSEPITDPLLTDSTITSGEVKELTVYEKVAKRKGIQAV